jgi:AcrR family transcriptional regulator
MAGRRERERMRHRQEILAAAAELLRERGPDGLTMD